MEVVEFPAFDVVVEMDELVSLGADAVVSFGHVLAGEFVIMVVHCGLPVGRVFAVEDLAEASSLDIGGDRNAGEFEECRGEVDICYYVGTDGARFDFFWPAIPKVHTGQKLRKRGLR